MIIDLVGKTNVEKLASTNSKVCLKEITNGNLWVVASLRQIPKANLFLSLRVEGYRGYGEKQWSEKRRRFYLVEGAFIGKASSVVRIPVASSAFCLASLCNPTMENEAITNEVNPGAATESSQPGAMETVVANVSWKRRRNLDSVITSIVNKRLQKRDHNDGMAMPVFVHSPGGDILISCRDSACRCKQADHTKFPLFSHPGARPRFNNCSSNLRGQATICSPVHSTASAKRSTKSRNRYALLSDGTSSAAAKERVPTDFSLLSDKQTTSAQLSDMKLFAEYFRRRRFELGYTQKDVAAALAEEYRDIEYTQPSIAKFEHLHFSPSRLHQMKHRLQKWLDEAERTHAIKNMAVSVDSAKKKNGDGEENMLVLSNEAMDVPLSKYPNLDDSSAERLRLAYSANAYPTIEEMNFLAEETGLTTADISHWFSACRRQHKIPDLPQNNNSNNDANGEELSESATLESAEFALL
ncbi:Pou and Homeobox KN domain containing protein [Trichuris trichiura]|uniref:Pou and Homeobox KN domain containing protein n=1 Tax=Trichuris trichiura TaxID=36087 RepID=A0A077Z0Y3_TRITR|nr:Pou and Homeobox KN domain containing protein [Trichuris trichiura]